MSAPDLWNAIDDGVALVDGDGVVCNVNRPFAAIFGTSTDKLIGVPVENLVHDSTRRRHIGDRNRFTEAPIRRAMAG
ncbi:MAG: PAS domain-containing protein, partial [Acidimicrobiales bacterium]